MRTRSNGVDAYSFEEYADAVINLNLNSNFYFGDCNEEQEDLGFGSHYKEEDEEEELNNQIHEMNIKYNETNGKDIPESANIENCPTKASLSLLQEDEALFVAQNISLNVKTLKYLLIGDKATGKTTFLNSFLMNKNTKYYPTKSLDIKKSLYQFNRTEKAQIEFWDTNRQIIDSKMIQTYMKIANGFIFVCDIANRSSILYIKEQLENILACSTKNNHQNIHFYINLTPVPDDVFRSNLELFSSIAEHYHVEAKRINTIDLMNYSPNEDPFFKEFIKTTINGHN